MVQETETAEVTQQGAEQAQAEIPADAGNAAVEQQPQGRGPRGGRGGGGRGRGGGDRGGRGRRDDRRGNRGGDDEAGRTVVAASSLDKDLRGKTGATAEAAASVGKAVAERAKAAGITRVVFDRGGFLFHGRVKALADAAREGGLEF